MKTSKYLLIILLLANYFNGYGQADSSTTGNNKLRNYILTIEPGIGIKPAPTSATSGFLVSNLIQWKLAKRLSVISHTSYTYNNAFLREFNYINTDYNYSLSQKFGIGTTIFAKRASHTFSLMAGIQFDNFKETLANPEYETMEVSISSLSPDFGLMYNLKIGQKKYFLSYRMYLPLYPYPMKSTDVWSIDGNVSNLSLEIGVGMRLK